MELIDKNLFAKDIEPWPNQVFQKNFDAYFLLSYPPFQYTATEVYNPFSLMNNIDEYTIYIESTDGKKTMNYNITNSPNDNENYYKKFNEVFNKETYLVWQGEHTKWAMVSDAKNNVSVLATNWKIAGQIKMFYNQCLLSPKQFLQKVNCEKHEAIFLKNYAPLSILSFGNAENIIWKKYYIQCHVDNENDKLFYWPQFEKLFYAITKLLKKCKGIDLYASQIFDRRYLKNKMWYSTGKNAPVGGFQNYNLDNCEKVATKFLSNNQHLVLAFEGKKEESDALYMGNKNGLINFFGFQIFGNQEKQKTKGGLSDFHFNMCLHCHGNKDIEHNQSFEFFYKERLFAQEDVNSFLETLHTFCFIKEIHEVRNPFTFATYTSDQPLEIESIYSFIPEKVKQNHPLYNSLINNKF